jgi:hypothetical protein
LCGWLVTGHPTPSYGDEQEDMNINVWRTLCVRVGAPRHQMPKRAMRFRIMSPKSV